MIHFLIILTNHFYIWFKACNYRGCLSGRQETAAGLTSRKQWGSLVNVLAASTPSRHLVKYLSASSGWPAAFSKNIKAGETNNSHLQSVHEIIRIRLYKIFLTWLLCCKVIHFVPHQCVHFLRQNKQYHRCHYLSRPFIYFQRLGAEKVLICGSRRARNIEGRVI